MRGAAAAVLIACLPAALPAADAELTLPVPARLMLETADAFDAVRLPITPVQAGEVQSLTAEGAVLRQVWQIGTPGLTTLQVLAPLRDQVEAAGYDVLLECEAATCGGFEFRYATDTLPAPEMHVDLGDYRFLSAQRIGEAGISWLSLMISRAPDRSFVQITRVTPAGRAPAGASASPGAGGGAGAGAQVTPDMSFPPSANLAEALETHGRAVLDGIVFGSGAAQMGDGRVPALESLAAWMEENPEARVVLVGHTDADGALPGNIDLSRRRAEAVRVVLATDYGVAEARMRAEGVGYLAPLTTNATEAGRERNRRVEVVVDSPG